LIEAEGGDCLQPDVIDSKGGESLRNWSFRCGNGTGAGAGFLHRRAELASATATAAAIAATLRDQRVMRGLVGRLLVMDVLGVGCASRRSLGGRRREGVSYGDGGSSGFRFRLSATGEE
jgi:hypothetical protein